MAMDHHPSPSPISHLTSDLMSYALSMRRLGSLLVATALAASVSAQTPAPPMQADPVVRLLAELEKALQTGRLGDIDAVTSVDLPPEAFAHIDRLLGTAAPSSIVVRERTRGPGGTGFDVLADVLVRHNRRGRLVTWQIDARPRTASPERFEITNVRELASIDGLLRLTLETTKQYTIRNLNFDAPDLNLKMASGIAFVAETDHGITGLVLIGSGVVHFAPPHASEQGQLRIYSERPDYTTPVDSVFIRVHPIEFLSRVNTDSLTPVEVDPEALRRAQAVFSELSTRTYNLDLRDLTPDSWSLEPSPGSIVVEFRSGRRNWLTYARSPSENEDISFFDRSRGRNISVYASGEKLQSRGRYYSEDDNASYDVEHYGLELAFDPAKALISGRGSMRVRIARDTSALTFKLAEPLVISSVRTREHGPLLTLRVIGQSNVLVSFPQTLPRGTELVLDVFYSGRLLPQNLDREAITVTPQSGVQEQERQALAPEARFLYSNRTAWYPQSERTDYATAAMRFTVPAEFQMVASGTLASSGLQPADPSAAGLRHRRVLNYSANRPVRYLGLVISRLAPAGRFRVPVPAVAPPADSTAIGTASPATEPKDPGVNVEIVSTPRVMGRSRQLAERVTSMLRVLRHGVR